jgi:hypothetical protein
MLELVDVEGDPLALAGSACQWRSGAERAGDCQVVFIGGSQLFCRVRRMRAARL